MSKKSAKRATHFLGTSSLTRPLFLLSAASALFGTSPAQALDPNALPQSPTVVGGKDAFSQTGNTLNVNQSTTRTVIDWRSFNIGSNAQTNFNQPSSSSIAVNRVNGSANPSEIEGGLHANGQVWILNPNGVFFGKTARVDAAGIVASTANIDPNAFMSGSNTLQMTGADSGSVSNAGNITVASGGLAAFVAPSVRNSGTINATLGKVTLAAGTTYTLDLAGDRLVELGLGSVKAVVDNSGKIVNPGGTITLTAKAAGQVVDSVVNVSGIVTASSATKSGGTVILGGDNVTTTSTAQISADAGTNGDGGTITSVANVQGNYAGAFSARGGSASGNGGKIETSGTNVTIGDGISIDTRAPNGMLGDWTVDPLNVNITAGSGGGLTGSSITVGAIESALNSSDVTITTNQTGSDNGDLTLRAPLIDTTPGSGNLTLIGRDLSATGHNTISIAGSLTLDVNWVNTKATSSGWIDDALGMIGSVAGGTTINLGAGTYRDTPAITTSNVDIEGAGVGVTIIEPNKLLSSGIAHKYTADANVTVLVNGANNVTLGGLTIDGNDLGNDAVVLWNNSSGTIKNALIENAKTFDGTQTGQALGVDATLGNTDNLTVNNVTFQNFNKNAIDAVNGDGNTSGGGNINLTVENSIIIGAGPTSTIAQNGIVTWERGGGTVNATVSNVSFSGLDYTAATNNTDWAAGVLQYGSANGTVTVSNSTFSNVQAYISSAGGSAHEIDATTGNIFDGVSPSTATLNQLYAIENQIVDGTDTGTDGLVRLVAGQVYATAQKDNIQNAVDVASSGDTVNVQAGTYTGTVTINKSLTLDGANAGIQAANGTNVAPATRNAETILSHNGLSAITVNATGVTIDGFEFTGGNGRLIDWATSSNIDGLTIKNNIFDVTSGPQNGGVIQLAGTGSENNVSVSNNLFEGTAFATSGDVSATWLYVGGTSANGLSITGNDFVGGADNAVFQTTPALSGLNVSYNYFGHALIEGLNMGSLTDPSISYNNFVGVQFAAMQIGSTSGGGLIDYNTIDGTGSGYNSGGVLYADGIDVWGGEYGTGTSSGLQIENNTIENFTDAAPLSASDRFTAIYLRPNAGPVTITGNTIEDNTVGILANTTTTGSTVTGNTFSGNTIQVEDLQGAFSLAQLFSGNTFDSAAYITGGNEILSSLQSTINAAAANSTINAEGSFNENITDAKQLSFAFNNASVDSFALNSGANRTSIAGNLTASGAITSATGVGLSLNGDLFAGSIALSGNLTLTGASVLDTSAANGTITVFSVAGGGNALTINAGTGPTTLGNVANGGALTVDGNVTLSGANYTATSEAFDGAVTLTQALTTLNTTAANGNISLASVDGTSAGAQSLTLKSGTGTVSLGDVGDNFALGTLIDSNATNLTGSSYKASNITLGATTLQHGTTIDTSAAGGPVSIASVTGAANDLTINTGSGITTLGNVAGVGALTLDDAVTLNGTSYAANSETFDGAVTLNKNVTLDTSAANGTVSVASVVGNGKNLTINAGSGNTVLGNVGNGGALTVDGTVTLNGTSYVAASEAFDGAVTLTGDTTLDTSAAAHGNISVASVAGANNNLTINSGANGTGSLGNVSGVNALLVDDAVKLTGTSYAAASEDFAGAVTLTQSLTTLDTSATNGSITLASVDGSTPGIQSLTITAGSGTVSLGSTGANKRLGTLLDDNATTLTGATYNANAITLGDTTLGNATITLNTSAANGDITVASVTGSGDALTINTGTGNTFLGNVTGASGLTVDGTVTLTGKSYTAGTGGVSFLGAVTLDGGDTTLDTSAADGNIKVASVIGGGDSLTIDTGTGSATLGNVSAVNVLTVDDAVTLTGTSYVANSEAFDGEVTLNSANVNLNTSGNNGNVTIFSVDGNTTGAQNLTITAGTGTVTLGNTGSTVALGKLVDSNAITLTGSTYNASAITLGDTTLDNADVTLNTSAANGNVSVASVTGANNNLTINTNTGTTSLGNVSGVNALLVDDAVKLTGTSYAAASEEFDGEVTLVNDTTLDTSAANGSVTLASVDGAMAGGQNLTITTGTGTVGLGDVGDSKRLNILTDNNTTTLTGGSYTANGISLGATTLQKDTTLTVVGSGNIAVASVAGAGNDLTLDPVGNISLGNVSAVGALVVDGTATLTGTSYVAASEAFDGAVTLSGGDTTLDTSAANGTISVASVIGGTNSLTIDSGINGSTSLGNVTAVNALTVDDAVTLTGNSYVANSEAFDGEVTLTQNTTTLNTGGNNGNVTIASVDGTTAGAQNLTITAGTGTVSLGNTGNSITLGKLVDSNTTTLTGGTYDASAITLGDTTLDNADVTLNTSAANGNVSVASVTGANNNLTINTNTGTTSLGNVSGVNALLVDDAVKLTGTSYAAASEDFAGAVTLTQSLTTLDTSGNNGDITLYSVDGTTPGTQSLTITAGSGTVSLGSAGANKRLGTLLDDNATTLTGATYNANAITLGDTTLNDSATLTTFAGGDITVASVTGAGNDLTLDAAGNTSLGNVAGAGALTVDGTATLTGTSYVAASEAFDGAVTLSGGDTTLDTSAANGTISVASVIGGTNSLTIDSGINGSTSLGNVTAVNALTVDDAVTLTGNSYVAASEDFDGEVTLTKGTTLDTSVAGGAITVASVTGAGKALTINAGTGNTTLGDVTGAGALTVDGTATLNGTDYTATSEAFDGAVTLADDVTLDTSATGGNISVASVTGAGNDLTIDTGTGTTSLGNVAGVGALLVDDAAKLTGNSYVAASEDFAGAVKLTTDTTLDTSAHNGAITLFSVDGTTTGGQSLTITAGSGTVSLGDVGDTRRLNILTDNNATTLTGGSYKANSVSLGATTLQQATTVTTFLGGDITVASVTGAGNDLTLDAAGNTMLGNVTGAGALTVDGTATLTGSSYTATSEAFDGAVTLTQLTTTIDTHAANGAITLASVDGAGDNLTLKAGTGTVSLGDVGDGGALGAVKDNNTTTLTGGSYDAASFLFGATTLENGTTITTTGGNVTLASVDGTAGTETLDIDANGGVVSLGDVGDAERLGAVTDDNTTTLTGNSYVADSFDFGATTLTKNTTIDTSANLAGGDITLASVEGAGKKLTLLTTGGDVSLGEVGGSGALGAVTDDNTTTLTAGSYEAASFDFGATTLTADTTLDTSSVAHGSVTLASVDGTAGTEALTIDTNNGAVSLGDVGDNKSLGAVTDENATTLTGGSYNAASFDFGDTTLTTDTTITATGDVTLASVDGTAGTETLDIGAGTVHMGDVGDSVGLGAVTDENTTTLTGDSYVAASFDFGDTALTQLTTTIDTHAANGAITLASVDGAGDNLTLKAGTGTVSLGDVGDGGALGAVKDNNTTTLTGGSYDAASFLFGATTLENGTTITTTGGNVTLASVDGTAGTETLDIDANGGVVSLGDVGDAERLGAVTDDNTTTLTGNSYVADSFDFGATTLTKNTTTIDTSGDSGDITLASVDGTSAGGQSLTLKTGAGTAFVGDVGSSEYLNTLKSNNATTLTGNSYAANEVDLGATTLNRNTTIDTTENGTGGDITLASVDGATKNLTLKAGTGAVSLGDVGDLGALGNVRDNNTTELTGTDYAANSFVFGDVTLDRNTTVDTTSNTSGGDITLASVEGAGKKLTLLTTGGDVSLGEVGSLGALGAVTDNNTTELTANSYIANGFDFGATTLDRNTTIDTTSDDGDITLASVDGAGKNLTLNAGAGTVSMGDVGDFGALGNVKDENDTTLTGASYAAADLDLGATTLTQTLTTLDTSAANGDITLASVDGSHVGLESLTLSAGTGTVSLGDTGTNKRLDALVDESTTTLTGRNYDANSLEFDAAVTLKHDTTMNTSADDGDITLASVDGTAAGAQNLTLKAGNGIVSLGDVGDSIALGDLTDENTTTLEGTSYKAASIDLGDTTLAGADTTLDTSAAGGGITVASVTGDGNGLELNAGTGNTTLGDVSGVNALTVDGTATLTGTSYEAGSEAFDGAVTLASGDTVFDTSANNGNISVASVTGDGNGLEINTGTGNTTLGAVSGVGALKVDGTATLNGATYVAGSETFGGAVTLADDVTLDTSAANGDISVASVTGAGNDLTVNAGTGNTTLGSVSNAGALTVDGTATLNGASYVATSESFDGAVTLADDVTLDTSAANGDISVASVTGAGNDLTVNAGTGNTTLGSVSNAGALTLDSAATVNGNVTAASFTSDGTLGMTGDLSATGAVALNGASTITGDVTADSFTTASTLTLVGDATATNAITFGGATNVTGDLTAGSITANDDLTLDGDATATGAIALNGAATLSGDLTGGSIALNGATTLTGDVDLDTSAANGAITVASVDGTTAGGQSLTINAGTGDVSLGNAGAATRLGAVSDTGNTTLTGSTYDADSFVFNGGVTLTSDTTVNTTQSASAAGDITFNGDISGTTNGGQSLTLIAGPGTGSASANGDITLENAGTSSLRLNNMTVTGNNFTADVVWLANNFTATLTGNQAFSLDTLHAGGNVTSNVGGNATGHIEAVGDVTITAGGDITGVIDGKDVTLNALGDVDATVDAIGAAIVEGKTIEGTYDGNTVSLFAFDSVNASVDAATTFNLIAPTGSVTGTWTSIDTDGSGSINVNGQQTLGHDGLNANQLVVEGFTLPAGSTIGANGQLILPPGLLLGLLSPGGPGGKPKVILVHSVQQLGELLAEGYTVIVIDLSKRGANTELASNWKQ